MTHITNWPRDLNWPFSKPMFSRHDNEREFWRHLLFCRACKKSFQHRFDDYDLVEEKFWMQVQEYISGAHLSLERISKLIRSEARYDLIDDPTEETSQKFWKDKREIDYHLMICSLCSSRYYDLYQRLKDIDPDVRSAHEKWYGLRTKNG